MNYKKRIVSAILTAVLLLQAVSMTSCSESKTDDSGKSSETTGTTETAPNTDETDASVEEKEEELSDYDKRQLIPDDLPEFNGDGRAFRVLQTEEPNIWDFSIEIKADELTGDACNDAVYNRNVKVEDRFNVKIELTPSGAPFNDVVTFTKAGTDDYDLVGFHEYKAYVPLCAKAVLNWIDVPNINLEKPWHNSAANEGATINNQLYAICSDLAISSMVFTYAMFANVDLASNYGYTAEDFYTMVREGTWTLDKFGSIIEGMYVDENGDGKADLDDTYGFGYKIENPADVWFTAAGEHVFTESADGKSLKLSFMSEKLISLYQKLYNLHFNNIGYEKLKDDYEEEIYFINKKLVFAPIRFATAYSKLREMDATYSMLPIPKYDEAQQTYYTNADDNFTLFSIPTTAINNVDFVSIIYEALCAESYKTVYPAFYDTALKGKYSTDAETAEMVDLIMAGRAFDFAFQFGESYSQRLSYFIRDRLLAKTEDIVSQYERLGKLLDKNLAKLGELYGVTIDAN